MTNNKDGTSSGGGSVIQVRPKPVTGTKRNDQNSKYAE
eukprot:CAMPEP_0116883180 /NCGR_PEP_ID=MMETSP0463-20121206/15642_1 /TAXON_ID=181622 /ORGANISM="Strombidinopsis sp, Strain SopsisLIS2011" /LENGTH=37 /DNA_ID= /DNA_START= /DNA_END= /DNA_ORIENTATION=